MAKRSHVHGLVAGLLGLSLALTPVPPPAAAEPISRADYEACQARDESTFRSAIETITLKALRSGTERIDYPALVGEEWRKGGLDAVLDKAVDEAVAEVAAESSYAQLWATLTDKEKAQELAKTVAERVYRSAQIKGSVEQLAGGVGREVGRAIELAVVDAGEPALRCMQAFLGPRYGAAIARAVATNAGKEFSLENGKTRAEVSTGAVIAKSSHGIAGAVVLLVRRQLSNMAARMGQRLVGSVLGRLVSVVAGGVGVALIAKDLWDFRHGALPIIATEMKSRATKAAVQAEIARTINEQISEHVREIAAKTAERVVEIWQEFRQAHLKVIEIAERNDAFKRFVDGTRPEQLARLDEIVALIVGAEGEAGVEKRLGDGSLHLAVNGLAPAALEIARETRSLATALAWAQIAGGEIGRVHELDLHRRTTPQALSKAALARILGLGDKAATTRLASVPRAVREVLLELEDGDLRKLARALPEAELETLSRYLTGLDKGASQRVLRAVADNPSRMQMLAPARVRDGLLASRDQAAAVAMMLRADAGLDPGRVAADVRLVYEGRISPVLLVDRHPAALGLAAVAALVVLLLLMRLLRPRRRTRAV
jgi:hypothetical protein